MNKQHKKKTNGKYQRIFISQFLYIFIFIDHGVLIKYYDIIKMGIDQIYLRLFQILPF